MFEKQKYLKKKVSWSQKIDHVPPHGWKFKQKNSLASDINVQNDTTLLFGFPTITQIIYPFQTARIATGWTLQ